MQIFLSKMFHFFAKMLTSRTLQLEVGLMGEIWER